MKPRFMVSISVLVLIVIIFCIDHFKPTAFSQTDTNPITALAWSPHNDLIAVGYENGDLILFDAETIGTLRTWNEHADMVSSIAWNPDGDQFVSGSYDNTLKVWDITQETSVATLTEQYMSAVLAVSWSPDNTMIIDFEFSSQSTRTWDAETYVPLSTYYQTAAWTVTWSPNGSELLLGNAGGGIEVRNAASFEAIYFTGDYVINNETGQYYGIFSTAWSSDGNLIAGGNLAGIVIIWNASDGDFVDAFDTDDLQFLEVESSMIHALNFSADDTLTSSIRADGAVRTWHISSGELVDTTQLGTSVSVAAWSPDGSKLAYGGSNGLLNVIDAPMPPQSANAQPTAFSQTNTGQIRILAVSPDGNKLAVGYRRGMIEIRDEGNGEVELSIHPYHNVWSISWSHDSSALGITYSKAIGPPQRVLFQHGLEIIDTSGNVLHDITVDTFSPNRILAAVWNPNGDQIAAILGVGSGGGGYHRLMIWDTNTGAILYEFSSPNRGSQIDWSPDGSQIVVTSFEGKPSYVVNASSGEVVAILETEQVSAVAWNESGDQIATGSVDGQVIVWDVDTAEAVFIFESDYIRDLAWSPDDHFLASATLGDTIDIWDIHQGILVSTYTTSDTTGGIAWNADGTTFIYSDYDRIERVDAPQVN